MHRRGRLFVLKLLIASLLLSQFALAFHSHDATEGIHCDACIATVNVNRSPDHDDREEQCPVDLFYHVNVATSVDFSGSLQSVILLQTDRLPLEDQTLSRSAILPFGSRAPPIL